MYYNGQGIEQNYKQALYWYIKVGEQGHKQAQLYLSMMYEQGQGVEKNTEQALYWLTKANEQGITNTCC